MATERVVRNSDCSGDILERAEASRKDGNASFAKGDYADACQRYDEGLLTLARAPPASQEQANETRVALHLNAALAHIRRGTLKVAIEHASGALAMDANNAKAFYRRGLARSRLSEHPGYQEESKLAISDFERALELEPANSEVKAQLHSLRERRKAEQKEAAESQRKTFEGMFSSGKQVFKELPKAAVAPVIRSVGSNLRPMLSAEQLEFSYVRGEPLLTGVDLTLMGGWCVGMFGNNASGKTTLIRLLCNRLSPTSGRVLHHADKDSIESRTATWMSSFGLSVCVALVAICAALWGTYAQSMLGQIARVRVVGALLLLLALAGLIGLWMKLLSGTQARFTVLHVTSDTQDRELLSEAKPIEAVIGEVLPKRMATSERRDCVVAMLRAAGFQMYNQKGEPVGKPEDYIRDGLKFGKLSGGQRHLIHVLRCFAKRPDVMLCDELLGGLDAVRQPRVLQMLNRLKKETGMAVLYVTTELHQLRLVSDSIGFLADGHVGELGPADEVLDFPKHPSTKSYISHYRGLPGGEVIGGKLAKNFVDVAGDGDLHGPWIPP